MNINCQWVNYYRYVVDTRALCVIYSICFDYSYYENQSLNCEPHDEISQCSLIQCSQQLSLEKYIILKCRVNEEYFKILLCNAMVFPHLYMKHRIQST